jgi:Cd2+/Zn2+-exporting ATPase
MSPCRRYQKVFGSLLPENKSDKIAALLKEYGTVAMVGDGINTPALALSTVGIAMGPPEAIRH